MQENIKLKFEFGGKKYEAESKGWVRLPDGTQLKVVSSDDDGNATVERNGRKGIEADAIAVAVEVAPETPHDGTPPVPTLADLKARWETAQKAIGAAVAEQQAVEPLIAAALVAAGEGQKEKPPVALGGNLYKAQRSKDGSAPPKLVKLAPMGKAL